MTAILGGVGWGWGKTERSYINGEMKKAAAERRPQKEREVLRKNRQLEVWVQVSSRV